jgi:hypothetical protein
LDVSNISLLSRLNPYRLERKEKLLFVCDSHSGISFEADMNVRRRCDNMSDISAWIGIILAVLILLGIVLEGLGLIAIEWLERRISRKQKIAGTGALLVLAVAVVTRGLLQIYGH